MIKILDATKGDACEILEAMLERGDKESEQVTRSVMDIIAGIEKDGDKALRAFTKRFDGVKIEDFIVSEEKIQEAYESCDNDFIKSMERAMENIEDYHKRQLKDSWITNKKSGVILGQLYNPMEKVGIYVPGGTAAYPSSVLMNAVPAKVAGVGKIIMVTPPLKDGTVNKNILAAARIAGVDEVYRVGGAQAVAALAYGTQSIEKVDKIVGPGNIYVASAKRLVFGRVDIDMIAGPSEVLIVADETANPRYVAADMLSQAEHDVLASSILVSTCAKLAKEVAKEIKIQTEALGRKEIIEKSIKDYGAIIVVESLQKAIDFANELAPEHLEMAVKDPFSTIGDIKNAGAVFLGEYSPEPLGDYFAGPNHTLPTSGTAKFFSPLGVDDFVKKSSLVYYDKKNLEAAKNDIINIAQREGLDAHANSIAVRFE